MEPYKTGAVAPEVGKGIVEKCYFLYFFNLNLSFKILILISILGGKESCGKTAQGENSRCEEGRTKGNASMFIFENTSRGAKTPQKVILVEDLRKAEPG